MFAHPDRATIITLLLFLPHPTSQVDITLVMSSTASVTCTNIPPGYCCQTPTYNPLSTHPPPTQAFPLSIQIHHLQPRHLASIYLGLPLRLACTNTPPHTTIRGPGSFHIPNPSHHPITGASYIFLPYTFPLDATVSEYLAVEGLLGLQAGDKQWTAPGVSPQALFRIGHKKKIRKARAGSLAPSAGRKAGRAYIRAPVWRRYPDLAVVDGREFYRESGNTSALEFRDADGRLWEMSRIGGGWR
ncbi:MAG: hypothetical protein L6R40_007116 [Gallowayella cf. fulva]|nr:MAG: hypothetical protein L6R40_007116 [Xanthomendoza cf. fulva]